MAGIQINALPAVPSAQLTDVFPVDQGPTTYKETNAQLLSLFQANGAALTAVNDTNVTMALGGAPTISLLNATSMTLGWTGQLSVPRGGTAKSSFTAYSVICGGTTATSALQNVVGLGNAGEQLTSNGAGALPTWQAGGTPSPLTTKGDLYTFSTVNDRLPVGTINGQILQVNSGAATGLAWSTATYPVTATNVARLLRSDATNWVETTSTFADTYAASSFLYANGANNIAGLATANNGLPVTGNTGIPSILAGPGSTGNILQSNTAAAPSWSAATYPSTYALGDTVYGSAANVLSTLTGNITTTKQYLSQTGDGANSAAPVWSTVAGSDITGAALTRTDDTNVTMTLGGTPTTALLRAASMTLGWTGTLSPARGGTGVNNGSSTLTLAGNLATSGAFASTFTMTGATSVTFPTSGTLATTSQIPSITNWVAYTPTFTGFGTVSNVQVYSRRVGDSLHIRGRFQSGTPTGTEARITLGYAGTNANVTSSNTTISSIQIAGNEVVNFNQTANVVTLIEANVGYFTFGLQSSVTNGLAKLLGTDIAVNSSSVISFKAEIPVDSFP